jgi:FKBP-type peptidyl-prolyl cis-trans isomerase SlyD
MSRRVFAFHYVLKGADGVVLDASEENQPLAFLEGAAQIIPGLEAAILDLDEGEKKIVFLKASEAYGPFEEKMVMNVPRAELSHLPDLKVGSFLSLALGDQTKVVKISQIDEEKVTLDGNHPLAGQDLHFEVEMASVRNATQDEIAHGHAHGIHGHHHHSESDNDSAIV